MQWDRALPRVCPIQIINESFMKKIIALAALIAIFAGCNKDKGPDTVKPTGIDMQGEIEIFLGQSATLTATLEPSDATADISWESSDEGIVTVSDGELTGVGVGTAVVTARAGKVYAECGVTVLKPKEAPEGAVDLGLELTSENGSKYLIFWAKCNLGAGKPEEYGDYYAWGETEPYYGSVDPLSWKSGKEAGYEWASYRWCDGTSNSLTKYNTKSGSGTVDNKTVLEPADDAAHVSLGGDWRMPTEAEWKALVEQCSWTWTDNYNGTGVAGHIVSGKKEGYMDKSIFLPATGYMSGTSASLTGFLGSYWASSLSTDVPVNAWNVILSSGLATPSYNDRCVGQSVRPVSD